MFGIKTRFVRFFKNRYIHLINGKLSNDTAIRELMNRFVADTYGHRADIAGADLGYGWVHYGLIRAIKPSRILCIGSRCGYIPAVLAQACKDNKKGYVDFVDPGYGEGDKKNWTGVGYWKTDNGKKCFERFGLKNWVGLYLMESKNFVKQFSKRTYNYIYIDGDHSYGGVSFDFRAFWPKLKRFGVMVFHDISVIGTKKEGKYGVAKFWKKVEVKNSIKFPFIGSGLGILQKN